MHVHCLQLNSLSLDCLLEAEMISKPASWPATNGMHSAYTKNTTAAYTWLLVPMPASAYACLAGLTLSCITTMSSIMSSASSGNHVVALHKGVVLVALHGGKGVVDVAVARLVSAHIQDQVPHAGILQINC